MDFPTFTNMDDIIDISYSNYYTKFLLKAHNYQDISKNNINLQRNEEVDMFFILKYKKQIQILQHIIIICCVGLIGSVLYENQLIPNMVYTMYLGIVFGIGLIIILYELFDIFIRNSNDFKQYDYEFIYSPPTITKSSQNKYNSSELSNMPTIC
jgi:hypothetical protein